MVCIYSSIYIEEIGPNSDSDEPEVVRPSLKEMIEVCWKLEGTAFLFVKTVRLIM